MPITEAQEIRSANARQKSKVFGQDRVHPMCINVNDGRLYPNVKNIRKNPDYRVYTGDVNAPIEERMQYLRTGLGHGRMPVTLGKAPVQEAFDISTASRDDLIAFADSEYGYALNADKPIEVMRQELAKVVGLGKDTQHELG